MKDLTPCHAPLLDLYTAQSGAANAYAVEAMENYGQQLLGEWRASGQQMLELPTHVRVQTTYSQTKFCKRSRTKSLRH